MRELQSVIELKTVTDYVFTFADATTDAGSISLSQLFDDKDTLFVIHNMGESCVNCTQWADGFNGILEHLEDRAAFVISTPDSPEQQRDFAAGRGWHFTIVSHIDTSFAADMGYRNESGYWPGVSVFKLQGTSVVRVSDTVFGPGDDFNPVWNFFDMIPEGDDGWEPKYSYV